jgi:uncharacterized membrane protein YeaQ/YmgE (transglycosylase-associated protein family)
MSSTTSGVVVGLLLALAAIAGGFTGFLLALVLGAVGGLVAAQLSGTLDLGALVGGRRRG